MSSWQLRQRLDKGGDTQQAPAGKGRGNRANGAGPAAAAPGMTAKERAQAIIDASFKEVKQDLARKANAGRSLHHWASLRSPFASWAG